MVLNNFSALPLTRHEMAGIKPIGKGKTFENYYKSFLLPEKARCVILLR